MVLHKVFYVTLLLLAFFTVDLSAKDKKREPTNAKELAQKKLAEQKVVNQKYAKWKATLSPEQRAWETVLEGNLGGFYLPRYKKSKMTGRTTAWDYVKDDPKLPRLLIIGDSVSRGYTQAVRAALKGKVNVHRAPANCGPTRTGLKKIDVWLGNGKWDIITFNFGIHDRRTKPKIYAANLKKLIDRLKKTNAQLIWVTTTPLPSDSIYGPDAAIVKRNKIAATLMQKNDLPQCDLYTWIYSDLKIYQNPKDCHFSGKGYHRLAEKVSQAVLEEVEKK
ncbi:hypothetical protein MNBD_PLANCTO02-3313 [hydrothermal vent metagenome]|uniref:SGNH hydrolase-type esterase domain-containing protein n=1 Tax=hydrothermal vent metagenome TaxID=652676 RepID=A0A3B1E7E4_9ZZZZ